MLYREHKVRKVTPEKPLGKTLLVTEVPPSIDEVRCFLANPGDLFYFESCITVYKYKMFIISRRT